MHNLWAFTNATFNNFVNKRFHKSNYFVCSESKLLTEERRSTDNADRQPIRRVDKESGAQVLTN